MQLFYINFFLLTLLAILNFFLFLNHKEISRILNLFDEIGYKNKIHKNRAYPLGGIIFFVNIFALFIAEYFFNFGLFFIKDRELLLFFVCFFLLFLLGFYDDKLNLSPFNKSFFLSLIFYFLVTFDNSIQITQLRFATISGTLDLGVFSKFITIFFFLMFINAFNMFDGINLQSGLYSFIVISLFSFFIVNIQIYFFILFFLFFFLYYNLKFNVFLGNTGSLLFPFVIGYYFIKSYNIDIINFTEEIYIYMCLPGLDMFRLFLIRILKKQNPFRGDLCHIHHLILKKYSHVQSSCIIQFFILLTILCGYLISFQVSIVASLLVYLYLLFKL